MMTGWMTCCINCLSLFLPCLIILLVVSVFGGLAVNSLAVHAVNLYNSTEGSCLVENSWLILWLKSVGITNVVIMSLFFFFLILYCCCFSVCAAHDRDKGAVLCIQCGNIFFPLVAFCSCIFALTMSILGSIEMFKVYPLCTSTYDRYYINIGLAVLFFESITAFRGLCYLGKKLCGDKEEEEEDGHLFGRNSHVHV